MDDLSKNLILLNGVPHSLVRVLANAKMAPVISINIDDLHALPHCGGPAESSVEFRPAQAAPGVEQELVFFKQNGGYTLLLGRAKFEESGRTKVSEEQARDKLKGPQMLRGRLLSTMALKKCRLENEEPAPAQAFVQDFQRDNRTAFEDRSYQGNRMQLPQQRESAPQHDREPTSQLYVGRRSSLDAPPAYKSINRNRAS